MKNNSKLKINNCMEIVLVNITLEPNLIEVSVKKEFQWQYVCSRHYTIIEL